MNLNNGTPSSSGPAPVLFVHGLWLHASSWEPWAERFAEHGRESLAPGWPDEAPTVAEARADPARGGGHGIADVVAHFARIAAGMSAPPVVVGHSFGGIVAQRLLTEGHAVASVAIDAAPVRGNIALPASSLRVASIALRNPANYGGTVTLTLEEFRDAFANALPELEATTLYERWTMPSPGRPLFEAATANVLPHSPARVDFDAHRGPLLLVAGGQDRTVPASITRTLHRLHERRSAAPTDLVEYPDRGHSLTIDHGWAEVADATLAWLKEKGI